MSGDAVAEVLRLSARVLRARPEIRLARQVTDFLESQPIRILGPLEHALRDRRAHRDAGVRFVEVTEDTARGWSVPRELAVGVYGLASCVRNGYVREIAVRRLADIAAEEDSHVAIGFLMMRLADPVRALRSASAELTSRWLVLERARPLVRALPLARRLDTWRRGAEAPLTRELDALLARRAGEVDDALWAGARDADSEVRREACKALLRRAMGLLSCGEEPTVGAVAAVLEAALDDPDPATRLWAARSALALFPGRASSPSASTELPIARTASPLSWDDAARILARLRADRSAWVRLVALGRARADGDDAALWGAALDPSSKVRFAAREALGDPRKMTEIRPLALAVLEDPTSTVRALVGALAALSDVARRADIPRIEAFLDHANGRVAAEARRTLGKFGG